MYLTLRQCGAPGRSDLIPQVGYARPLDEQVELKALAGDLAWRGADIPIARDRPRLLDGHRQLPRSPPLGSAGDLPFGWIRPTDRSIGQASQVI